MAASPGKGRDHRLESSTMNSTTQHSGRKPREINPAAKVTNEDSKSKGPLRRESRSQATELVAMAALVELFHDPNGDAYATFNVNQHRETWPVRSKAFRQWLARKYWEANKSVPGSQSVQDAISTIEGMAIFDGSSQKVWTRIADASDNGDADTPPESRLIIDLADPLWRCVVVTPKGWKVVNQSPVKFRRAKGMLPLSVPKRGGSINLLRQFINASDSDMTLILAWLMAAFRPAGPFPVLNVNGEQGSAKSTACRVLRELVDPNESALRQQPRSDHDLVIAASNSWVVTLDNLSGVPIWLSDSLCRLATGGGFSTRLLFFDTGTGESGEDPDEGEETGGGQTHPGGGTMGGGGPLPPTGPRKYFVNDVAVKIVGERIQYYGNDGKLITESLKDFTRKTVLAEYASMDQFLQKWTAAEQKQAVLAELEQQGILLAELAEQVGKDFDPFDLVCHVAFDQPPLTRRERAENVKKRNYFAKYGEQARAVLEALLDKYADEGIEHIETINVLRVQPLSKLGTPVEIVRMFGGREQFDQAVRDLESALYSLAK